MNLNALQSIAIWTIVMRISFAAQGASTNDLKFGAVTVEPATRSISFPAQVNQRVGQVEYLLVHETGKVHESIFRTSVAAQKIHAAALLLSEKATNSTTPKLKVKTIEASWTDGAGKKNYNSAELILDKKHHRALKQTKWAYRGSRLIDGVFLAQRDGSLIAIMEDRDALIDQDTPDASDDENWEPITEKLPSIGDPVVIRIIFEK